VHCAAGDAVGAGQLLVTLQALDSAKRALPGSAACASIDGGATEVMLDEVAKRM
jgi:hypothetical protein